MKKIRILLADDHAILRAGIRALLETQPDLEVIGEAGDSIRQRLHRRPPGGEKRRSLPARPPVLCRRQICRANRHSTIHPRAGRFPLSHSTRRVHS